MERQDGLMGQSLLPKIAVVILAGGQSSRMGSNKALLADPRGATLLDRACDTAMRLLLECGQDSQLVFVSGSFPDRRSIQDIIPSCGPTGGIHAALAHILGNQLQVDYVMFIPIDMPALEVGTLKSLVESVAARGSNRPSAVQYMGYELPILIAVKPEIEALLVHRLTSPDTDSRSLAIKEFLKDLDKSVVEPRANEFNQFINVNRPDDYHQWLGALK